MCAPVHPPDPYAQVYETYKSQTEEVMRKDPYRALRAVRSAEASFKCVL